MIGEPIIGDGSVAGVGADKDNEKGRDRQEIEERRIRKFIINGRVQSAPFLILSLEISVKNVVSLVTAKITIRAHMFRVQRIGAVQNAII